ncbi:MAG: cell division protein FtsW [Chloroflexi bacterium 13_1_40CM_4_68_4]|nr:MAG: cell division protein FtsW [Chloroflexi bacterium 13_1_40CM_4_68_4]
MRRNSLIGYDLGLLFCVLTLLALGILMVYSASGARAFDVLDNPQYFLLQQSAWGLTGLAGMAIAARVNYHRYRVVAAPLLAVAIVLLLLVLVPALGIAGGGATRWLRVFGPFALQPAEFAKLALVVYVAAWLASKRTELSAGKLMVPFLLIVGAVAGLVVIEPDLGTAIVLVGVAMLMYFAAGARLIEFGAAGALAAVGMLALAFAPGYRSARLLAFLDPWTDPSGKGFHTLQALYSLAFGGIFGEGLGAGREKFGYLPAPYTDSIYAVLADELGLIGALAVIFLFGAIVLQGLRIARRAPDTHGALLAVGITASLGLQAWINMAVVAALVPVTGITLPFISYGGSSLLVSLTSVGILLNVGRQGSLEKRVGGDTNHARGRRDRRSYEPAARGERRAPRAGSLSLRLRRR